MKSIRPFIAGFLLAAAIFGGGWYIDLNHNITRQFPDQISFDSEKWRQGDAGIRGQMYLDAVRYLNEERPSETETEASFGPSGFSDVTHINGADIYLVYQIDLGQRVFGKPFLDKLGIAFHEDGSYSHTVSWD